MGLKCSVAGRFLWQLGTETVSKLGIMSLQNCAFVKIDDPIIRTFIEPAFDNETDTTTLVLVEETQITEINEDLSSESATDTNQHQIIKIDELKDNTDSILLDDSASVSSSSTIK